MRLTRLSATINLPILLILAATTLATADTTATARISGFQLYDAGRFPEAISALDQVLNRHPRDIEALIKRGNCQLRLEHAQAALADFDRVIRLSPLNPSAYTDRGIALLMLDRHQEALDSFERAIRYWSIPLNAARGLSGRQTQSIQAGKSSAQAGIAQTYHRMGRDDEAVEAYDRAIALLPTDPNPHIGRGDSQAALGHADQALADYSEAIRLGPGSSRAYSSRGRLLADRGQNEQALADFSRAIELDPGFAQAYSLRGALLSRLGQNDRALVDFESVIRLRPDDPGGFKDRGGVLVRLGRYQLAIDDLNKAIALDPNRPTAYLNRGAAYSSLGQYERAIDDLNKAIALDPKNPGARTNIGLAFYMIGQYDRAVEDLSEAVKLAPSNAIVHLNRANVYARLGFKQQAIGDYETANHLNPRLIASYGGTARLLEEMGRQSLALRNDNITPKPDSGAVALDLANGHALRSRGDWAGAIAVYNRVLEHDPKQSEVYVARGWARLCAGVHGADRDARSFLDLEGWRHRLSPYMALLGFLGSRQAGRESDAQTFLDEAIANTAPGTWPLPVLKYLRHDLNTEALLKSAAGETQETEAHTVVALEMLHRGDRKQALTHLRWVRDQGKTGSIASDLARATLERLEHPGEAEAIQRIVDAMLPP